VLIRDFYTKWVKKSRAKIKAPKAPKAIKRCDLLHSTMNANKAAMIHTIIDLHRAAAPLVACEQWRLFFETGTTSNYADVNVSALDDGYFRDQRIAEIADVKAATASAARAQMLRRQVVGQLESWLGNRKNEFRDVVEHSTLDPRTRHQLHTINQREAWHSRLPITIHGEAEAIGPDIRRLARRIMKSVMKRHRRPSWRGLPVQLDAREAKLLPVRHATQKGRVDYWIDITAAGVGKRCGPLCGTPPHRARKGAVANTIQISRNIDGQISFGIVTDMSATFAASREVYVPRSGTIGGDFGMNTLFALSDGSLLGQGFLKKLIGIDANIQGIARHVQRSGGKLRDSENYRRQIARMRGMIETEIGRVFNRLVKTHAPSEILLERLDFSSPTLSRRMNRLVQNCGRGVLKTKLQDLEDRFGIKSDEIDPAYTSQECSSCGHVHSSNRSGEIFVCRRCGLKLHADVNAARNIRKRRSLPALDEAMLRPEDVASPPRGRRRTLERLRQAFVRRYGPYGPHRTGGSGPATDSRREPLRFAWDEVRRSG
jgi:putative transposase